MKRTFVSVLAAVIAGMVGWAPAKAAQVNFIGTLTIVGQSGVCDYNRVGDRFSAQYRPANLGDNNSDTNLTLFSDRFALGFRKDNGLFTTSFQTVEWITLGGGFGFDENITVQLRIITQSPTVLQANTAFVILNGSILNYDFDVGCAIVFQSAFVKRVEN